MATDVKQKIGQACALALFQSYETKKDFLKKFHKEFTHYGQLIRDLPLLEACLHNPLLSAEDKHQIVENVFKPKALKEFMDLLVEKNLVGYLVYIVKSFDQLFKGYFHLKTIRVKTQGLDASLKKTFEAFLARCFKGYETEVAFETTPDIYGGFIIEADNFYWDNSLKGKLELLKMKIG